MPIACGVAWDLSGHCVQMKVSYSPLAPFLLFLIEWMDYSCLDSLPTSLGLLHILVYKVYVDEMPTMSPQERKATLRDFYAVIYPSLKQLEGNLAGDRSRCSGNLSRVVDEGEDDECGICMESGANMVLPNCAHSMCINCFHHWYVSCE
ncbi:E3 ubiquitin-protein ligase AIRP2-like isoform X2 [Ipomoea triloba]|uniref:E3 ubiquitin-protein ligase AIRP2-like isoform X2 n=1 Tax=Ipomoea triloba TaxID=35885 RepID=UPI00125DC9B0|nr:E3 ubiquitin-protein ligase AIRP2-like isoform X2 [Ipomoea triloba]